MSKSYTFTTEQLIAWAKEQAEYADVWQKDNTGPEGYKMALQHLIVYVKNPVKEII